MENNFNLSEESLNKKSNSFGAIKELFAFIRPELKLIIIALLFVLLNSYILIIAPERIGEITGKYIVTADKDGLFTEVKTLALLYLVAFVANFLQIRVMGSVGQKILYNLRKKIFEKLQELPLQFFNSNKSGDLISRINNDTDKLNQAFSETLLRFIGQIFVMIGIAISMIRLDLQLAGIVLGTTAILLILTSLMRPLIRELNKQNLDASGKMSGEIQEALSNFKVIVAFGQREYFQKEFEDVNEQYRDRATKASIINTILTPIYDYASYLAMISVILIIAERIIEDPANFGLFISFTLYTNNFFSPLKIMAQLFTNIQTSLAAWARISKILHLESTLLVENDGNEVSKSTSTKDQIIRFKDVEFGYSPTQKVLHKVTLSMEAGKTYALVGPTGGGKSTTASLIARLFDTTSGNIKIYGRNIKSYTREELSDMVGFILQEPFLLTGTVYTNLVYGNNKLTDYSEAELLAELKTKGLDRVIERFPDGLSTKVSSNSNNLSLGQKQLVSFMRALLREPQILILDEATANIDTITENLLEEIIQKLPRSTTKIIIAHRLNTIEKADQIFFIAGGKIEAAGNLDDAIRRIKGDQTES